MNLIKTDMPRETVIRRYMSLSKFESLLTESALYFTRFDRFEDRLEGGINSKNFPSISNSWEILDLGINRHWPAADGTKNIAEDLEKTTSDTFPSLFGEQQKINGEAYLKNVGSWLYASCWTDLPHECQAMWQLYGNSGANCRHDTPCIQCHSTLGMSLCIETTIGALVDNLILENGLNGCIRKVEYLDHRKSVFLDTDLIDRPFFAKALHFSYENEIRLMVWPTHKDIKFSYKHEATTKNDKDFVLAQLRDINSVINRIILSPLPHHAQLTISKAHSNSYGTNLGLPEALANNLLRDKVERLLKQTKVACEIVDSDLNQVSANDCYSASL